MASSLERSLMRLQRAVQLSSARAMVTLVDDAMLLQSLQARILRGELRSDLERFQEYGFTSVPKPPDGERGAEAVILFLGGAREHGVVIAVDDRRYRLKALQAGEVALYDDQGQMVKIGRSEVTVLGTTKVSARAPTVELVANAGPFIRADANGLTLDCNIPSGHSYITLNGPSVEIAGLSVTVRKL